MSAQSNATIPDPEDETNRVWDGPRQEPALYCSYGFRDENDRPSTCIYSPDNTDAWIAVNDTAKHVRHAKI